MFKFDIAISYAGEEVGIAEDLWQLLQEKDVKVFFAKVQKDYLFGKLLKQELPYIFGPHTKFVVPIISKHYVQKRWPKYEFNLAKKEEHQRPIEVILPIFLDDVNLKGLLKEDKDYIDLRKEGLIKNFDVIIKKLRKL